LGRRALGPSGESNQAKPREKAPFVPEAEPRRTKIAPAGKTTRAPAAPLLARGGNFSEYRVLSVFFGNPGAVRQNTGISPRFARTVLDIAPEGGAWIKILKELSYGNLSA
jgi:hypothetical protein